MNIFFADVKSNSFLSKIFLLLIILFASSLNTEAMYTRITLQDSDKGTCKLIVLKSTGEKQKGIYAKVFGNFEKFEPDENGDITIEYTSSSYTHTATLYFNGESDQYKKKVQIDTNKKEMTVYFDSPEDIMNYKRTARLFSIDGMLVDGEGNPVEQAIVSIQGTGRRTLTDEMGLFQIEADFNHPIVIRADGMNNLSLPISHFFQGEEEHTIIMQRKNAYQVYSSVEKMPEFPGGMKAFQHYLDKNLEYPEKAKKAKIEGVVVVQFIVEKDGDISSPRIARHLETTLDTAAWKAIKNMPRWIPASDYGTTVRCKYSLPVAFKIPVPKPISKVDSMNLIKDKQITDSLSRDSMKVKNSLLADSLKRDSLMNDSLKKNLMVSDSIKQDSTQMIIDKDQPVVKAKKRNIFVRFFRWLFGIERRQRKRSEKEQLLLNGVHNDSLRIMTDSLGINPDTLNYGSKATLQLNADSIRLDVDSLDIDLKELEKKAKKIIKD